MHEQSETIQNKEGKWVNVYGGGVKGKGGNPLPLLYQFEKSEYDSVKEAEKAARKRSSLTDAPAAKQAALLRKERL